MTEPHSEPSSSTPISLFGKLSSTADFVRIQHASAAAIELDVWLTSAVQELYAARVRWPEQALRFLFVAPRADHALTGVVVDSRDRAGRKFPLALYRKVSLRGLSHRVAALPHAAADFHEALENCLPELVSCTKEAASARLLELRAPELLNMETAATELDSLLQTWSADEFERGLFTGEIAAQAEDAYQTARDAALRSDARRSGTGSVIDFPIRSLNDVGAWLTLWSKLSRLTGEIPSLVWSTALGRLLLVQGVVPPALPLWLAEPHKQRARRIEVGVRYAFVPLEAAPSAGIAPPSTAAPDVAADPVAGACTEDAASGSEPASTSRPDAPSPCASESVDCTAQSDTPQGDPERASEPAEWVPKAPSVAQRFDDITGDFKRLDP